MHKVFLWLLFAGYLVLLFHIMFRADQLGRSEHADYAYNLTLFKEIKRFYEYRETIGYPAFLLNIVGNVVLFMPFGFILPALVKRANLFHILVLSIMLSLFIEVTQLFTKLGSFDVDDIFLNVLGGVLGCIVFYIRKLFKGDRDGDC